MLAHFIYERLFAVDIGFCRTHFLLIWTREYIESLNISCLHLHLHRVVSVCDGFARGVEKFYQFTSHIVNEKPKVRCFMFSHGRTVCMHKWAEMKRTHKFCFPTSPAMENLRAIFSLKLQAKQVNATKLKCDRRKFYGDFDKLSGKSISRLGCECDEWVWACAMCTISHHRHATLMPYVLSFE